MYKCSETRLATLKGAALVAYPVDFVLLNCAKILYTGWKNISTILHIFAG